MAAVIKELSSHLGNGAGAIFSSWSLYLLIAAGAATMLLASHSLAAGPLAASQPGFTILDPLSASLLGAFLFGEHIRAGATDLAGEALALAVVIAGAAALSHSCHVAGETGENSHSSCSVTPAVSGAANPPRAARDRRAARPGAALPGAGPGHHAGTAHPARPRHRPDGTSPARVRCSPRRSPAAPSRTTTRPSTRKATGLPRRPPSRARAARAPRADPLLSRGQEIIGAGQGRHTDRGVLRRPTLVTGRRAVTMWSDDRSGMKIATAAERPELLGPAWDRTRDTLPEYNNHGDVLNEYWPRLTEERRDFQFHLTGGDDEILARARSIPLRWDGTVEDLPAGIDGAIARGFDEGGANVLCALVIMVPRDTQGRGMSAAAVRAMGDIARRHGLDTLIAPVRPSWKERYPLVPIERYACWRRPDGWLFDPWMRVHERLGAAVLKPEPRSLRITGTTTEWESWTGMTFPDSGDYWFPGGLATVNIDREHDRGSYWEPNVWMRHVL